MPSKSKKSLSELDNKIRDYFPKQPYPGDIGIEVELEGVFSNLGESMYWNFKEEGSLRSGMEFILSRPVNLEDLPRALSGFANILGKSKPVHSLRTSTHYHVNVSDLTIRQVYNFLAAYYLLEPLLVDTQPEKRKGNLFCLRMQDAETIANDLVYSVEKRGFFRSFTMDRHKYAALNLASIRRIGSVEFRFLDSTTDTEVLDFWARLFHRLVHTAKKVPPVALLSMYDDLPAPVFIESLIGAANANFICKGLSRAEINKKIHTNYDSVFELAQVLNVNRFELPQDYWNEDLIRDEAPWGKKSLDWAEQVLEAQQMLNNAVPGFGPQPPQPVNQTMVVEDEFDNAGDVVNFEI